MMNLSPYASTVGRVLLTLFAVTSTAAQAMQLPESVNANTAAVVKLACRVTTDGDGWGGRPIVPDVDNPKFEWVPIDPDTLFYFLVSQAGGITTRSTAKERISSSYLRLDKSLDPDIIKAIRVLQANMDPSALQEFIGIKHDGTRYKPDRESHANFQLDNIAYFSCKRERKDEELEGKPDKKTGGFKVVLRGDVDALSLTGDKRKSASAAQISLTREKSYQDDGSRKRDLTLAAKGAVGIPLVDQADGSILAFASYELSRTRSRPQVVPVPPARIRDGDTDVAKFGLLASSYFGLGPKDNPAETSLVIGVEGSYAFDFVDQSENLRAKATFSPYFQSPVPNLCGIRYFLPTFVSGLRGRCVADAIFEVDHFTKVGRKEIGPERQFVMFGGRGSYELMLDAPQSDGSVIAGASIEYRKFLSGGFDHLRRHEVFLKYRHWFGEDFALEWGINLADGANFDSFADENKLNLNFGILF